MKHYLIYIVCFLTIFSQEKKEIDWSLQIRNRSNFQKFNKNEDTYSELRSRLAASVMVEDNLSAFLQIQDSRNFGSEGRTISSGLDLFFHQAYLKIDKLFDSRFNLKLGRMEVNHTNQRIVGSVGWSNVGRSFDGAILSYEMDDLTIDLFSHKINESRLPADFRDQVFNGIYFNYQIDEASEFDLFYYSLATRGPSVNFPITAFPNPIPKSNLQTVGLYLLDSYDTYLYEFQAALQFGQVGKAADYATTGNTVSFAGHYIFARISSKMNEDSQMSLAFEMLSGDDQSDPLKLKTFLPFFGTNHKFNGHMDKFFVGEPVPVTINGLNDLWLNVTVKSLSFDFHHFMNNEDFGGPISIGSEIDVIYKYKYSDHLTITPGAAYFIFAEAFKNSSNTNDLYLYLIFNLSL